MFINRPLIIILLTLLPLYASAYIDQGVTGSVFKNHYVLIFAIVMAWLIKPWRYIKKLFPSKRQAVTEQTMKPASSKGKKVQTKE